MGSSIMLSLVKKAKKMVSFVLPEIYCSKLSLSLFKIKQMLDPELKKYFSNKQFLQYFDQPVGSKDKVIFLGLRTFSAHPLLVFEKVLADFLRRNGASAKSLMCDNVLDSCDVEVVDDDGMAQELCCYKCKKERKQYVKLYRSDYLSFSQFISTQEMNDARSLVASMKDEDLVDFTYLNVDISRHAIDSTIKYFRKGNFDPDDSDHIKIMRHNTLQGVVSLIVAKNLVEKEKPTHLVSLHGCYASWGPFCDYCAENGVHVVIYVLAVHKIGCFLFPTYGRFSNVEYKVLWDKFKDIELSATQKAELREFLFNKKGNKTLDYKLYNTGKKHAKDNRIENILNSNEIRKYVLFPNLLWDIGLESGGSSIFRDVYDWMFKTIDYFAHEKEKYLLIKPHPSEASIDFTKDGTNEVIVERFGELPENIILIPKDYPTNSFNLMKRGCIGITYNGTIGMEYSYFKKPILAGGKIHYADAGVTKRVNSLDEYFKLIEDPKPLFDYPVQNYDLIEKYLYLYFYRLTLRVPVYRNDVWLGHCVDWEALSNYQDFLENDENMNHIAKSIIDRQLILLPN